MLLLVLGGIAITVFAWTVSSIRPGEDAERLTFGSAVVQLWFVFAMLMILVLPSGGLGLIGAIVPPIGVMFLGWYLKFTDLFGGLMLVWIIATVSIAVVIATCSPALRGGIIIVAGLGSIAITVISGEVISRRAMCAALPEGAAPTINRRVFLDSLHHAGREFGAGAHHGWAAVAEGAETGWHWSYRAMGWVPSRAYPGYAPRRQMTC